MGIEFIIIEIVIFLILMELTYFGIVRIINKKIDFLIASVIKFFSIMLALTLTIMFEALYIEFSKIDLSILFKIMADSAVIIGSVIIIIIGLILLIKINQYIGNKLIGDKK